MTPEISKILTLSTSHISEDTSDNFTYSPNDMPAFYDKAEFGWFISVPEKPFGAGGGTQDPPTCPKELVALLAYARALDCQWLCLDRDGDINPLFEVFDW
jgi:hypothetical protein